MMSANLTHQVDSLNSFSMSLEEIAEILSAKLIGKNIQVKGISTDTRTIKGGELFLALKGPNFDGHNFINDALSKGAVACLVQEYAEADHLVVTNDTHQALGLLATAWRKKFNGPVIAVTGSNGKTTVKEMIASILRQQQSVMATHGNLNNDIGVPLTLFRLNEHIDAAVIEMGANHSGEIDYLTSIALPDIAVITNIGAAHLEGFGSIENTAKAKGEIFNGLPETGIAIINSDDAFAEYFKDITTQYKVLSFGIKNKADVMCEWKSAAEGSVLNVTTPIGHCEINLKLLGRHNVMNALASIAVSIAAEMPLEQIVNGLEALTPVNGRLQIKRGLNNSRIIDDTYNANPTSLHAALNVLHDFSGKRFLALGDMGELGSHAVELHIDAGIYAKQSGVDSLYSYGKLAEKAAKEFGANGFCYEKHEDMINALRDELTQEVTLLVKGSRSMQMENVVNALTMAEG
ncbi:MAG: UDP-N-acetylmuramoyl-tripeptide--D-alanyl-D-alanine ligase [Gammaproteobacteria bacterium]|nr:UDP-N-acetylmuramoyl-tripeptide--D-alanyl-D-alanine ligase [Gammaproteobacteria bacterium]MCW8987220.1 UDP-N-acetylmuramoyl-tripeptide--D-alanyl-D-alanine ligase [Gammaproteobacteria bacterium]MCW9031073.1 UDP-N-acetylmuramoyl-tripeptide--D-alanyl-D-alanine ligase [Gammaproteobacteria bacterium]